MLLWNISNVSGELVVVSCCCDQKYELLFNGYTEAQMDTRLESQCLGLYTSSNFVPSNDEQPPNDCTQRTWSDQEKEPPFSVGSNDATRLTGVVVVVPLFPRTNPPWRDVV